MAIERTTDGGAESRLRSSNDAAPDRWEPFRLKAQWVALAGLGALICVYLAHGVQERFAPVVLFPMLIGGGIGGLAGWIQRWLVIRPGRCDLPVVGLLAACAVVLLHASVYLEYRREFQITTGADPRVRIFAENQAPIKPPGILDYLHGQADRGRPWIGGIWQGRGAWITWGIDAALAVASAIGACWFIGRPRPAGADG